MRKIVRMALLLAAIPALAMAQVPAACACSCAQTTEAERFAAADAVFTGVAIKKIVHGTDPPEPGEQVEWVFDVESSSKGDVPDPVSVWTSADGGTCGFQFAEGSRYEVFSRIQDGRQTTGLCNGTRQLEGNPPPNSTPSPPPKHIEESPKARPTAAAPSSPGSSPAAPPPTAQGTPADPPSVGTTQPGPLTLASGRAESTTRGRWVLFSLSTAFLAALGAGVWWRRIRKG